MSFTRSIETWRSKGWLHVFVGLAVFFVGLPLCLGFFLVLTLICILGTPVGIVLFYSLPDLAKLFPIDKYFSRTFTMVSAGEENDFLIYTTLFLKENQTIIPTTLSALIAGLIFGGLHCAGWNLTYPTTTEQTIWRFMSSSITLIPFLCQLSMPPVLMKKNLFFLYIASSEVSAGSPLFMLAVSCLFSLFVIAYLVARLSLIALALAALREQPASAYVAVQVD
jgi:hypothetical protein